MGSHNRDNYCLVKFPLSFCITIKSHLLVLTEWSVGILKKQRDFLLLSQWPFKVKMVTELLECFSDNYNLGLFKSGVIQYLSCSSSRAGKGKIREHC